MISTVINLVNSQCAADPVFFAPPWIPTPGRQCRDGHPRGPFLRCSRLPLAQARFPRYFRPSGHQTDLPIPTLLTMALRLDFSYEATTPSRLDLVLRQQGRCGDCLEARYY